MSNTAISIEATGELVTILGGSTHSYRFENTDPENPVVAMLSITGPQGVDAMTTIPEAKMRISMCPASEDIALDAKQLLGKAEGVANWTEALLQLIQDTDCNPDDEDEFNEIMMSAGMFLQSYRDFVKK